MVADAGAGTAPVDLLHVHGLPKRGEVVGGKYQLEEVIGSGGMGVVVRALHLELGERVAVKFLNPILGTDPLALERFEREARAVFRLQSEHVVRVLDVGRLETGTPFLVMELLEGEDLAALLASAREPGITESVGIVLEACEALAEAHAHGVVHRDLKPENIFLADKPDGTRRVKVLDFGLSKIAPPPWMMPRRARPITAMQQPVGTPNYMAPELWTSAHEAGPACDQWALGALLYELIAGAPAFVGDNVAKLASRMLNETAPSLGRWRHDVPAELERAVARAMEKEPARRFPSLLELAEAIAPFGPPRAPRSVERIRRSVRAGTSAGKAKRGATAGMAETPATAAPGASVPTVPAAPGAAAPAAATPVASAPTIPAAPGVAVPGAAAPGVAAPTPSTPAAAAPSQPSSPGGEGLPASAPEPPTHRKWQPGIEPTSAPEPPTERKWQRLIETAPARRRRRLLWLCLLAVALAAAGAVAAWALGG